MEHKEEINARHNLYYQSKREEILARQKRFRENNLKKVKLRQKKAKKKYYHGKGKLGDHKLRLAVLKKLGEKCIQCGFADWRALQIDHVKNNGAEERKELHYKRFYKKILEMTQTELQENYQLLCANCNWIKKYET